MKAEELRQKYEQVKKDKAYTGRNLGSMLLEHYFLDFSQALKGKKPEPTIPMHEFYKMLDRMTEAERQAYNIYPIVYGWVTRHYNIAQAKLQEAQVAYRTLKEITVPIIVAENSYLYIQQLPYIVTRKQYDEMEKEAVNKKYIGQSGKPYPTCLYLMIKDAAAYYLSRLDNKEEENPLRAIKAKYEKEPIEDKEIIKRYQEHTKSDKAPTKWDIINNTEFFDIFPKDFSNKAGAEKEIKAFADTFPEFIRAMISDMIDKYFTIDIPNLTKEDILNSPNLAGKLLTPLTEYKDLYDHDFYGERKSIAQDVELKLMENTHRVLNNGIAILAPNSFTNKSRRIDKKGYYIEPKVPNLLIDYSLEGFFPEAEHHENNIYLLEHSKKKLAADAYYLLAYNYTLKTTGKRYDIPDITVFSMQADLILSRVKEFNKIATSIYDLIKHTDYTDKVLQQRKLKVLSEYFQPIRIEDVELTPRIKSKITRLTGNAKSFMGANDILYMLFLNRPEGGKKA